MELDERHVVFLGPGEGELLPGKRRELRVKYEGAELEVLEHVVVDQRPHVGQRTGLHNVLEVGVPEPDPLEPDTLRLRAAIREQVRSTVKRLHREGTIENVGAGRASKWKLAGALIP